MSRRPALLALTLGAVALSACHDSTGPSITFPALPAQMLARYCVRGERTPTQAISGSVTVDDCALGDGSYYETWRVRVGANGTYRFAASSSFDNVLFLLRVESYTDTAATLTQVAFDDDSGPDTNALISAASLQTGADYFLVVNGFGASDVGPYTVAFTVP